MNAGGRQWRKGSGESVGALLVATLLLQCLVDVVHFALQRGAVGLGPLQCVRVRVQNARDHRNLGRSEQDESNQEPLYKMDFDQ